MTRTVLMWIVAAQPSLPDEEAPPLSDEAPPLPSEGPPARPDDGWEPVWDADNQAYYFYNRITKVTQWENPRITAPEVSPAPGLGSYDREGVSSSTGAPGTSSPGSKKIAGGYNPAIHGDYDPNADYAVEAQQEAEDEQARAAAAADPNNAYAATGTFNRFTGKWQAASLDP
jgi:hypothetical protein